MDWINYAEREVLLTYGQEVSAIAKGKGLHKFGLSELVSTADTTVAKFGALTLTNETYLTTNTITHVVSDSTSDTGAVTLEGHTVDGSGNFTFVIQTVTLTGQTKAALSTPLARCSRMYSAADEVGNVYAMIDGTVSSGVPQTPADVHCAIAAGLNQSEKAATTFSSTDYFFMTGGTFTVNKKVSADVDVWYEVRTKGGVFRRQFQLGVTTDGTNTVHVPLTPFVILPPNSDIRIRAAALSGSAIKVSAQFDGVLATIL